MTTRKTVIAIKLLAFISYYFQLPDHMDFLTGLSSSGLDNCISISVKTYNRFSAHYICADDVMKCCILYLKTLEPLSEEIIDIVARRFSRSRREELDISIPLYSRSVCI